MIPEGTYLVWIDCSNLKISAKEFSESLLLEKNIRISYGEIYGENGKDFVRVNIACRRSILREFLNRVEDILKK